MGTVLGNRGCPAGCWVGARIAAICCALAATIGCASHQDNRRDAGGQDAPAVDAGGGTDTIDQSDTSTIADGSSDAALDAPAIDSGPADLAGDQAETGDAATEVGSLEADASDAADAADAEAPDVPRPICAGLGKVEDPRGCTGVSICDGAGNCVSRYTVFEINRLVPSNSADVSKIIAGPDGNLWFSDFEAIGRMTPTGVSQEFAIPGRAFDMTAGPDGNIWFTDDITRAVGRLTTDGVQREFPRVAGRPGTIAGITTGPDGNLWLADFDAIDQVTTSGVLTPFLLPVQASYATSIVVGSDGNLWFTEQTTSKVGRITTAGVITEFPIPEIPMTTASSLEFGMAAGSDGALWFAEPEPNKIGRITTAGVVTEYSVPTPGTRPTDITAGPDGNLWFTENQGTHIGRITPAGVITEFTPPTPMSSVGGITGGPDGAVWFTEIENTQVVPFRAWVVRVQP